MNTFARLSISALLLLTVACTDEAGQDNRLPEGEDGQRREVLLTLKNKLVVPQGGTKAAGEAGVSAGTTGTAGSGTNNAGTAGSGVATKADTPIATTEENFIRSLDVYVFGSETEGGDYTFQELFYYRDNAAVVPGDWAQRISLTAAAGGDNATTALMKLTKGLYVKIYCVANREQLYSTAADGTVAPYTDFQPLVQSAPGQAGNTVRAGVPTETDFLKLHTKPIDPAATNPTEDDILVTPLPMAGSYTTALDLTDFSVSARTQVGFKLTRTVSRFDIANNAATSKFTITGISMAQARPGASFFPIRVLGTLPTAVAGELITTPTRPFTGDKANNGLQTGAFYSYASPTEDAGYLILKGNYAVNQSESQEVSYQIPFKPEGDAEGGFLEITHNHRYTIAITKADAFRLDFTMTVADWNDDGSIDDYTPGGGDATGATVDVSVDPTGKTTYDEPTHTITMLIAASSKFEVTASASYVLAKNYAGMTDPALCDWLDMTSATVTKAADGQTKYTFSAKSGYTGTEYPEVALRFTQPDSGEGFAYRVVPVVNPSIKTELQGYDAQETDGYRVKAGGGKITLVASSPLPEDNLTIATSYDAAFGQGNLWLPAPTAPTKKETVNNRYVYTYEIVIPATTGTDPEYQLHKGTVTVKNGSTDIKTYTIWRGASNMPYLTGDATNPYYTAIKKGTNWWAPVNCGAKQVAQNGNTHTEGIGNIYQWGRKDETNFGYYPSDVKPGPISNSTPNDKKFYTSNILPYDWLSPKDDSLWKNGVNDPCPEGYRVPTLDELLTWGSGDFGGGLLKIKADIGYPDLVLPAAGGRDGKDGSESGRGTAGGYWSGTYPYFAAFDSNTVYTFRDSGCAAGFSLRCVRK